jgi:hypothetical protein
MRGQIGHDGKELASAESDGDGASTRRAYATRGCPMISRSSLARIASAKAA